MCVYVRLNVYTCQSLPSWPPVCEEEGVTRLFCQLPVTQCHPNQIDRGRHTATGPKFPIPFPPIHQSVCVNVFLLWFAASLYFTAMFSLSVYPLAHIYKCKSLNVHSNSKYAHRFSCFGGGGFTWIKPNCMQYMLSTWSTACSGCWHNNQNAVFSQPCFIVYITSPASHT